MASTSQMNLCDTNKIYLIGYMSNQIVGSKLPSNKQVLCVLFYNMRVVNLNVHDSASLVYNEIEIFWQKTRIPIKKKCHSVKKIQSIYNEWRKLQKHATRKSLSDTRNEEDFVNKLDDLFDIAHSDALNLIKIEVDKQFLLAQREKGRSGCMLGVDKFNEKCEINQQNKNLNIIQRKRKAYDEMEVLDHVVNSEMLYSSSNSSSECDETEELIEKPNLPQIRGKKNILTDKLAAAFDRCKISDRDAVHILMATAESFGLDTSELIINKTSINNFRKRFRENRMKKISNNFNLSTLGPCTIHWDGKLLPSLSGHQLVERLPIIVSNNNIEQLLDVPEISSGSGQSQAAAVYAALEKWSLTDKVKSLCCDTTASNTGRLKGACILLEQMLGRDILYLSCRHHIYEIILKSVFEVKFNTSSGPDVPIFNKFQKCWQNINKTNYLSGIEDTVILEKLKTKKDDILKFSFEQLQKYQPRDDYKELLELVIIFFGETPLNGIYFKIPGPIHHARWMAKAIYCLKIFLFRGQFELSIKELNNIRSLCIFITSLYIKQWFSAPNAALAPNLDLQFIKNIIDYEPIDKDISKVVLKKISGHLWYLVSETAAMAFFDDDLCEDTKIKMVNSLNNREEDPCTNKRIVVGVNEIYDFKNKNIDDFISTESKKLFERYDIETDFLNINPLSWKDNSQYIRGKIIVNNLKVINDLAERGVKLIEEYNNILTKDEAQKQYLLQIVTEYRRCFPNCNKSTLCQEF
ncbi:uncharacterized protein LOC126899603 [Daktulosphaira vitifoliae]|uniref:uncharacterized protein LOC126899603 n=1 Tax=Daktulosphaira vitifoliae TaxID=58002 RepID=UPI0021AAB398|nr:uncharacterized protein LOC126899603 [Daktulosphaira vitifoliae]